MRLWEIETNKNSQINSREKLQSSWFFWKTFSTFCELIRLIQMIQIQ